MPEILRAKVVVVWGICELRLLDDPKPGFFKDIAVVN